jgi:type IV secretion system protein VirB4
MKTLQRLARAGQCSVDAADQIPYQVHSTPRIIRTSGGDYVTAWRVAGIGFECADARELNAAHERLNAWIRSIAMPEVALWTHVVRRREPAVLIGAAPEGFARAVVDRYRRRLADETLWTNELYLTLVYRPAPSRITATALSLSESSRGNGGAQDRAISLDSVEKLARQVEASLNAYAPERLGLYQRSGHSHSSLLELLGLLVNGEFQPMPLPEAPLSEVLATSRLLVGWETLEYRTPTHTRFGAILGIKEYPAGTSPGVLDVMLTAPFAFVLTQSFSCIAKPAAMALLSRQAHRLSNSGDAAVSQLRALTGALDQLASNEFVLGDHHLTLQVLTELVPATGCESRRELATLEESIASARSILANAGILTAREDLALEAAFWAQLPGAFASRPRLSPITSRNFSALAALHDYPAGRASGNHWDESLAVLKTSAASPYHFSLHASDPQDPDGGSRRDTGHTFICGPTGSGKTVFLGFCVCLLTRQQVTQVIFDKDRGLEVLVRALGGAYLSLRRGVSTGCNPLQLEDSPNSRAFLRRWLLELVHRPARALVVREEAELDLALDGVMALDASARRLSRVLDFLDPTSPDGLHARLAPWCEVAAGVHAWVFDAASDTMLPNIQRQTIIGFDMTDIVGDHTIRGPLTRYLFHVVETLLDGRRMVAWLDEFSRLVGDPGFADLASDGTKTWRKRNGVIAFATQSPSDVLASPVARALVEQTPTKIIFPNSDARREDYVDGLGLNEREFELIRSELSPGSRRFLIKQGRSSVVAELDLQGFDAELKVISGRTATIAELHRLMNDFGTDPIRWLPQLMGRQPATPPGEQP